MDVVHTNTSLLSLFISLESSILDILHHSNTLNTLLYFEFSIFFPLNNIFIYFSYGGSFFALLPHNDFSRDKARLPCSRLFFFFFAISSTLQKPDDERSSIWCIKVCSIRRS